MINSVVMWVGEQHTNPEDKVQKPFWSLVYY